MSYTNDDIVFAVTVRQVDGAEFVADDREALEAMVGDLFGAQQCDACGNSVYRISRLDNLFTAVCTEDPDDEISAAFGGCGASYLIVPTVVAKVAMP